jgi:hypothetical protein
MRRATILWAAAALIIVAEVWACAGFADNAIKPGKWEISMLLPGYVRVPGVPLRPGESIGPEGLTSVTTKCASATDPPGLPPTPLQQNLCTMERDVNGDTATWTMNCGWAKGTSSTFEGTVHYHGDTLDGTTTSTMRIESPSGDMTARTFGSITGRYVGPCD